jgi:hypothetical protein
MKGEALLCPQWRDLCRLVKVSLGKAWSEKINKKENRKKRACTRLNVSVSAYRKMNRFFRVRPSVGPSVTLPVHILGPNTGMRASGDGVSTKRRPAI